MEESPQDEISGHVARLGAQILESADELADAMVEQIHAAVPVYRSGAVVTREELRHACLENVRVIFENLGSTPVITAPDVSRQNGRRRAKAGVPLAAVMEAYRVVGRRLWDRLAQSATDMDAPAEVVVRAASEMWLVLDTYTHDMADGYRQEYTEQVLARDQERSALVQALLEGRLAETNIWEAADLLQIPHQGRYTVIAAAVPRPGRHALPHAESVLKAAGITSAWRLLHDLEVGIVCLPRTASPLDRPARLLSSLGTARIGISPPFDSLTGTPDALRLARIALASTLDTRRVTVFEDDPLAIAAVSAPDVMQRLARNTLTALDPLSNSERALLLDTFSAWIDSGGSADVTAKRLYCHPNTVRYRLRRLEERTGRVLTDPRHVAELVLAFETDRRTASPYPPDSPSRG